CGLTRSATDDGGASTRHLAPDEPCPGQRHPQTIARTHRTVRTRMKRLARKTIGFSHTPQMYDIVLGVLVHRDACGRAVSRGLSPLVQHDSLVQHDPRPEASMDCAFSGALPRCPMLGYACSLCSPLRATGDPCSVHVDTPWYSWHSRYTAFSSSRVC